MWSKSVLVQVVLAIVCVTLSRGFKLQTLRHPRIGSSQLKSMGSDILSRPDDEDSPEYREYLKQLMKLQMNRAKQGHSAPSSGSSDAYIAKLNRLKVERLALIKAGLPDAVIDTSYRPEDYKAAIYEAAEPLISGVVLTGEAAIAAATGPGRPQAGRGQLRGLTAEEIAIAKSADEKVAAALERQAALGPMSTRQTVPAPSIPFRAEVRSPDIDIIDDVLNAALSPKNPAPTPRPTARAAPEMVTSKPTLPPTPQPEKRFTAPPSPIPVPITASMAAPVEQSTQLERKLSINEMESAANALKMLVKHRGGGPFGSGRVPEEEVDALENALLGAVAMLEKDTRTAYGAKGATQANTAQQSVMPVPIEPMRASKPVSRPAVPAQSVEARQSSPPPAAAPLAPTRAASSNENVPIAVGLDQFLSKPKEMSTVELSALRDGLIQVLGMLTVEIAGRPAAAAAPIEMTNNVAAPAHLPPKQILEEATTRIASLTAGSSGSEVPIEKEAKLALGLLLKHRGGPGFGHGRLEGKELVMMEEKLRSVAARLQKEAKA